MRVHLGMSQIDMTRNQANHLFIHKTLINETQYNINPLYMQTKRWVIVLQFQLKTIYANHFILKREQFGDELYFRKC